MPRRIRRFHNGLRPALRRGDATTCCTSTHFALCGRSPAALAAACRHSRPSPRRRGRAPLIPVPNHPPAGATQFRLSKSRVCEGLQCHKFLWWRMHEPKAPELENDPATQVRLEQGGAVGALARRYAGPGELIDFPRDQIERKVEATADAMR